jgi:DNA-binding PadR family transcriptional regulator
MAGLRGIRTRRRNGNRAVWLTPLEYHILLVLAEGNLYGYAIRKAVILESRGRVSPGIGVLYRALTRLRNADLVVRSCAPGVSARPHPGRRRKYYALTPAGWDLLRAESARLEDVLVLAEKRGALPRTNEGGQVSSPGRARTRQE